MFAKLFGTGDDQILVKLAEGEDAPEVRVYVQPEGLGVCSAAIVFDDSDEGWDKAKAAFKALNEDKAREFANKIIEGFLNEVPNAD